MTLPGLRQVEQDEEGREHRRIAYQPALDGMRGVGVVAMLLWHADVGWIGDGPLFSIEMFFVLSGYLITSLFIVERERTGRIDLRRFWVRRARRLLPALYGLVALVAVWAALPSPWGPNAFETTGLRGDGLSALAYVSNLWFIVGDRAYFGAFGAPSPFLHTWSLSLEEQFYAVLAVVCVLGLRRWAADNGRWVVVAVVGAVLSAVWMAFLARMGALTAEGLWPFGVDPAGLPDWLRTFLNMGGTGDQSRPYFGTFSRMQSVLVGMATAFIARRVDWSAVSQRTIEVLAAVGCGGLAILFLGTPRDLDAIFYGGFLLCDVLTAMAILGLTAPHRPVLWHSLSAKPFVAAGILSYSIYVWHFPLFLILTEERTGIGGWPLDVVRIGVSVAVAYASYRWLEYPIRAR
ncbi:MAG: acyltransferase, partial [Acidimicrobiales bacterium]|nr:acyltransferase [Acidimicrobiales bacterium]